jgi:hypothetical protein
VPLLAASLPPGEGAGVSAAVPGLGLTGVVVLSTKQPTAIGSLQGNVSRRASSRSSSSRAIVGSGREGEALGFMASVWSDRIGDPGSAVGQAAADASHHGGLSADSSERVRVCDGCEDTPPESFLNDRCRPCSLEWRCCSPSIRCCSGPALGSRKGNDKALEQCQEKHATQIGYIRFGGFRSRTRKHPSSVTPIRDGNRFSVRHCAKENS